jgi:hypothetical protein
MQLKSLIYKGGFMKNFTHKLSAVALLVAAGFQAQAEVRINGFANFTAGKTSEDVTLFGYTDDVDFSNGSLFALQVSGDVAENVTATAQIVSRGSNDYDADFEWAYLTYEMDDNSSLTAGRFRLPLFRYSTSLDVGYSYHWIAAPSTVYSVLFNNLNGIRYDYANYSGDLEYLVQVSAGSFNANDDDTSTNGKNLVVVSGEAVYNSFKGRLVWGRGDITLESEELSAALTGLANAVPGFEAPLGAIADNLAVDDDEGTFIGAGLEFDNFNWFVSAEYTVITVDDSFAPEDVAYYVTAGARLGKWTPHVTYQVRDGLDDVKFLDQVAQLPAPLQPSIGGVVTALQAGSFEDYSVSTVGVRYDATTSVAIKAEFSRFDNKIEPEIIIDTNLFAVSVNYVF